MGNKATRITIFRSSIKENSLTSSTRERHNPLPSALNWEGEEGGKKVKCNERLETTLTGPEKSVNQRHKFARDGGKEWRAYAVGVVAHLRHGDGGRAEKRERGEERHGCLPFKSWLDPFRNALFPFSMSSKSGRGKNFPYFMVPNPSSEFIWNMTSLHFTSHWPDRRVGCAPFALRWRAERGTLRPRPEPRRSRPSTRGVGRATEGMFSPRRRRLRRRVTHAIAPWEMRRRGAGWNAPRHRFITSSPPRRRPRRRPSGRFSIARVGEARDRTPPTFIIERDGEQWRRRRRRRRRRR